MNLESRLKRMEEAEARNRPGMPGRVIRVVAGEHDKQAALDLARAHGFNPDDENSNDFVILRTIVSPRGREPWRGEPCIQVDTYPL